MLENQSFPSALFSNFYPRSKWSHNSPRNSQTIDSVESMLDGPVHTMGLIVDVTTSGSG